jgi:hypothetical protein
MMLLPEEAILQSTLEFAEPVLRNGETHGSDTKQWHASSINKVYFFVLDKLKNPLQAGAARATQLARRSSLRT